MKTKAIFLAAAALLPGGLRADHQDFITINANATRGYEQRKFVNGVPQRQTYALFQGKFFGETNDPTLRRLDFNGIAKILAPNLAKQNYYPAKDYKSADLVIVVNWGSTLTDPTQDPTDTERQLQFDDKMATIQAYNASFAVGGGPDPSGIQFGMTESRTDGYSAQVAASYNARLLGYTSALNKEMAKSWAYQDGLSAKAESYLADLNQERYFVVLLAYDYQAMQRDHRGDVQNSIMGATMMGGTAYARATMTSVHKPGTPLPVWSVRMNIRAAGNSFTQALPAMSQMDQLKTAQVSVGTQSHVDIGDTKVMIDAK